MAGIFGFFDYTKEGKGVYPDEPPKGPFSTFFVVWGRKFWKMCGVNVLYILFSLPALALAFLASNYILGMLVPALTFENILAIFEESGVGLQEGVTMEEFAAHQMMIVYLAFTVLLTGLGLFVVGPVQAGITYILRNYSREEHAFIWLDFKDHAKKNFKQSLVAGIISIVVTLIFTVNISFYSSGDFIQNPYLRTVLFTLMVIMFVFWCIMQMYLYPMMITFDLPLKQLYKNSFLFTVLRLPLNLAIFVVSIILLFGIPLFLLSLSYGLTVLIAFVWYLFICFGVNLLLTNLFVYRGLDKYMIQRLRDEDGHAQEEDGYDGYRPPEPDDNEGEDEEDEDEKKADDGDFAKRPSSARS